MGRAYSNLESLCRKYIEKFPGLGGRKLAAEVVKAKEDNGYSFTYLRDAFIHWKGENGEHVWESKLPSWLERFSEDFSNLSEKKVESLLRGSIDPEEIVNTDLEIRKFKSQYKDVKSKYDQLLRDYEYLDGRFNDALRIKEKPVVRPITVNETTTKGQATAIVAYSDWHVEEVVERSSVYGLNEYNPEIAKARSRRLANNTVTLLNKERQNVVIDDLVIHLGGDFLGGWIHPELEQTNAMSPIDATIFAQELLYNVLSFLINNGRLKRIVCVCSRGNHTRTSKKMQFSNEKSTNYETIIYHNLAKLFDGHIDFVVPDSDIGYYQVYDKVIRFFHGHQIKYNGGVGGITPSLNKKQANWDKTRKADYNIMGHFHTLSYPNSRTTLNGSMKGFDAFANSLGFGYEDPKQSFQLLDARRGFTVSAPIFC